MLSQPKTEVQTLLIAPELNQDGLCRREEERNTGGGCFLGVLLRVFWRQERGEEAAGIEAAAAIERSGRSGRRTKSARPTPWCSIRDD